MDYLRTLGSAAVSTLVAKSGLNLPFTLGPKASSFGDTTPWILYEGTKRDDGSAVSVFEFDANAPGKRAMLPLAKNMLRKLRTTRHPDVLKFLDVVETDTTIHIMTERVSPLLTALQAWTTKPQKEREDWLLWGLHRISVALAFINDQCASTHGNICVHSIFISPSGEWKLGGLELMSNAKDEAAVLFTMGSLLPDSSSHASPEVKKGGWSVLKEHHPAVADAYALGLLLHTVFNPNQGLPPTAQPPHPPPTAASRGDIPTIVFPAYKRLLNPNPKARLSAQGFLEIGMSTTGEGAGFYERNPLVKVCAGLDNFALSSDGEKATFLRALNESAGSFPPEFASYRVLPSLVKALEFGGASAAAIVPLFLRFGEGISDTEYATVIITPLVKLYASPDRGTRMALLEHLPAYAEKLDKKTVVDKIWPHLQTGFSDTVAVIREATVKSIISLAPKFNERITNNDLLRHLAKMQGDPEPAIRTNTCILLGRLGPTLGYNTKRKVLVPAFARALKDQFVHARVAGLMAFMATADCFEPDEVATRVVPVVVTTTVDKEKLVRDQAFKTVELFMKRLQDHASTLPETVPEEAQNPFSAQAATTNGAPTTLANSAAGAAGALAGWALSSINKKLAASDLQTTIAGLPGMPGGFTPTRPALAPSSSISSPDVSALSNTDTSVPTPAGKPASARAMQLGANKVPARALAAAVLAEEEAGSGGWGDSGADLMDVNADEGDWSEFASGGAVVAGGGRSASALGFDEPATAGQDDGWGELDDAIAPSADAVDPWAPAPEPVYPTLSLSPATKIPSSAKAKPVPKAIGVSKTISGVRPTPVSSPALVSDTSRATSPAPPTPAASTAGLSKEEKAAEMARRKEERKQRIAALKEQKAAAAAK